MKEKLQYNFLHTLLLDCSEFYNCFLISYAQDCYFFVTESVQSCTEQKHCQFNFLQHMSVLI